MRTSVSLDVLSAILIEILSAPSPIEPRRVIFVASGASITKTSAPEVALAVTTTVRSIDPAIDLLAMLSTVTTEASAVVLFFPSTPARENDAPPLAFRVMTMVPLAEPPNVTTSFASETVNVADWTSATPPMVVASPTELALLAAVDAAASVSTPDIAVGFAAFATSITAFTAFAFVKSIEDELSEAVMTA